MKKSLHMEALLSIMVENLKELTQMLGQVVNISKNAYYYFNLFIQDNGASLGYPKG